MIKLTKTYLRQDLIEININLTKVTLLVTLVKFIYSMRLLKKKGKKFSLICIKDIQNYYDIDSSL